MKDNSINPKVSSTSQLENYTLLENIGEGGYGQVFKAKQISTGQIVAIKMLKLQESMDEQKRKYYIARFERETQLCIEINHPNIITLIDKGFTEKKEPFAVFEYISGETLKDIILKNKGLSPIETGELMGQVLDALVCAHSKGIIHRDLKPQNIMVTKTGSKPHIKVLDFGIGLFANEIQTNENSNQSLTNEVIGTPTYSAPEQLRGEPITVKSDLYSWGLIFVECLTGDPVMSGNSVAEVFQKQLDSSDIPLPPSLEAHPIANLLRKVLDKTPGLYIEAAAVFEEYSKINFYNIVETSNKQKNKSHSVEDLTAENQIVLRQPDSEKRQITVLCVKLSLSITKESILDLETLNTIQKDQLNLCKDTAFRFGGHIGSKLADNLIIYFGYPNISDNDARKAGRTALELINQIQKRSALLFEKHGIQLEIRIGMNSGIEIFMPNQIPEGLVSSIAFDLLYKAEPGNVLVGETTKKLLDPYQEFETSNKYYFPNLAKPLQSYLLIAERNTEALSFLKPQSANRKMIGRDSEHSQILDLWSEVKTGNGKTAIIKGQAGIGKSKLLYEIKNQILSDGFVVRECRCLPEHQKNALYPFFEMLKNHLGIHNTNEASLNTEKLKNALKSVTSDIEDTMSIFCSWLSIPLEENYKTSQISPEKQKEKLLNAFVKLILNIKKSEKLLLILEDLHWIDPTSQELMEKLINSIESENCLLLLTARPEYSSECFHDCCSIINLETLSKTATSALVKSILDGRSVNDNALEYIVKRTDGIPLFIEELSQMLLDKNYLVLENKVYHLLDKPDKKLVPVTLKGLLSAKLNKSNFSKETAQIAAVIGREFNYNLLVKASLRDEAIVQADLDILINADLIYRQRSVHGGNYIFRHALIRDAAYEGMLSLNQRETHGRIAAILENDFPTRAKENPFEIAQHYAHAYMEEKSITYGIIAAKQSLDRSLNDETLEFSKQVIRWLSNQEETTKSKDDKLYIYCIQTNALMAKYGWAAENVKVSVNKTFELLKKSGESNVTSANIISTYWALITYYHVASEREIVKRLTQDLLQLAKKSSDTTLEISAMILKGIHHYVDGEFEVSISDLETVMNQIDHVDNKPINLTIGIDNLAYASSMLGQVLWLSGKKEEGRKRADWAVIRSREISHIPSLCLTLMYRSAIHQFDNEKTQAKELTNEILEMAQKYGLAAFSAYTAAINFWATDMVEPIDQIVAQLEGMGCKLGLTYYLALPAQREFKLGKPKQAIERINRCLSLCEENKEYFYKGKLQEIKSSFEQQKKPVH